MDSTGESTSPAAELSAQGSAARTLPEEQNVTLENVRLKKCLFLTGTFSVISAAGSIWNAAHYRSFYLLRPSQEEIDSKWKTTPFGRDPRYFTVKEAAAHVNISEMDMRALIAMGRVRPQPIEYSWDQNDYILDKGFVVVPSP